VQEGVEGQKQKLWKELGNQQLNALAQFGLALGEGAVAQEKGRSSWTTPIAGKVWGKVLELQVLMTLH
jgi:hypothetical protein